MCDDKLLMDITILRDEGCKQQRVIAIERSLIRSLLSKEKLISFVMKEFDEPITRKNDYIRNCTIQRKSKKSKKYVPLNNEHDFTEFLRSTKVKKRATIIISSPTLNPQESPVSEALDQVRKLIGELQKSELWDILKTLTTNYAKSMSPDGECGVQNAEVTSNAEEEASSTTAQVKERSEPIVHRGITCDSCYPGELYEPLIGWRFKCLVCKDFDLCQSCHAREVTLGVHNSEHPMVAIKDSDKYRSYTRSGANLCPAFHERQPEVDVFSESIWNNVLSHRGSELKSLFGKKSVQEFVANLDDIIERANKYSELESLLGDGGTLNFDVVREIFAGKEDLTKEVESQAQEAFQKDEIASTAEILVVPKGTSLSQILITNKSQDTIDCKNLNLEIVNCFGKKVASVSLHSKHGIHPGRTRKFNVPVNNTHFKYPFRLVLVGEYFTGQCELSLKKLSCDVNLVRTNSESTSNAEDFADAEPDFADAVPGEAVLESNSIWSGGSSHSMLVPSLPKELLNHEETDLEVQHDGEISDEGYDLISIGDADDIPSDFEVLSPTNSNQQ